MRGVAEKADLFYELAMAVADGLAVADDALFQLAGAEIGKLEGANFDAPSEQSFDDTLTRYAVLVSCHSVPTG